MIIYSHRHRITTLPGFLSAVQNYAVSLSHPNLPRHRLFDRVRAGLDNYFGNTNFSVPRHAITLSHLCDIRSQLKFTSFRDARLWCACLIAFFALLRINEYCNRGLLVQHVTLHRWGLSITVPYSKTSLVPTTVDIIRRDDQLCPLRISLPGLLCLFARDPRHHPRRPLPGNETQYLRRSLLHRAGRPRDVFLGADADL